jgi:hypothetical protein
MVLEYHSGDKSATTETEARVKEYNVNGFPTMLFDGTESVVGSSSVSNSYGRYKTVIDRELAKANSLTIKANMISDGSGITLDISLTNTGNDAISGIKLMAVVYEDLGTDAHHYVVRDMLTPENVSVSPGQQREFNLTSTLTGIQNPQVVVFLQSASHQILQSTLATAQ